MSTQAKQMVFPPDVLARIAPDISLQRHLSVGLRPSLRGFTEFRPLEISKGGLNDIGKSNVLGLSVVKSGDTRVICGITVGIVEEGSVDKLLSSSTSSSPSSLQDYSSIYPVVEIARGRSGAPTDEEMILSQKLYESVLHNKIIEKDSLKITVGTKVDDEIFYPTGNDDEDDLLRPKKNWSYVLYAHIKVFSRSGPLFDICYSALLGALQDCKLPRAFIDDKATDIKIPVRSRGNFGHLRESYNLILDSNGEKNSLKLGEIGSSASFGIIEVDQQQVSQTEGNENDMDVDEVTDVLLADLEGEAEESCAVLKINIICTKDSEKSLKHVSIIGGGSRITKSLLRDSIRIAKLRSEL